MDHIDVDTCAGLDSGNIRIDEAAAASCYCYFDVIKPNVKQRGAHRGLKTVSFFSQLNPGSTWVPATRVLIRVIPELTTSKLTDKTALERVGTSTQRWQPHARGRDPT